MKVVLEKVPWDKVDISNVNTESMEADSLTNSLAGKIYQHFVRMALGIESLHADRDMSRKVIVLHSDCRWQKVAVMAGNALASTDSRNLTWN